MMLTHSTFCYFIHICFWFCPFLMCLVSLLVYLSHVTKSYPQSHSSRHVSQTFAMATMRPAPTWRPMPASAQKLESVLTGETKQTAFVVGYSKTIIAYYKLWAFFINVNEISILQSTSVQPTKCTRLVALKLRRHAMTGTILTQYVLM